MTVISIRSLALIVLIVGAVYAFRPYLMSKLPPDLTLLFSPEYLKSRLEPLAVGRGAYLAGVYPASVTQIILQTPIRSAYFLFSPFPWMLSGLGDMAGLLDGLMYMLFALLSVRGVWRVGQKNKPLAFALAALLIIDIITFAWGSSNFGTAIRHRQKLVWLLIAFASIGLYRNQKNYNERLLESEVN